MGSQSRYIGNRFFLTEAIATFRFIRNICGTKSCKKFLIYRCFPSVYSNYFYLKINGSKKPVDSVETGYKNMVGGVE